MASLVPVVGFLFALKNLADYESCVRPLLLEIHYTIINTLVADVPIPSVTYFSKSSGYEYSMLIHDCQLMITIPAEFHDKYTKRIRYQTPVHLLREMMHLPELDYTPRVLFVDNTGDFFDPWIGAAHGHSLYFSTLIVSSRRNGYSEKF